MRRRGGLLLALVGALLAVTALSGCFPWDRSEPTPTPLPATAPPAATAPAQSTAVTPAATSQADSPLATPTARPTAIIVTPPPVEALPTVPPGLLSRGDAEQGRELFVNKGCIACHKVAGEGGDTGPALDGIGSRSRRPMLAGSLPNTPENKWRWITNPHLVKPGTAMSPQPLSPEEAADLVAYLETLR